MYVQSGRDELEPAYRVMSSLTNPLTDYIARHDNMVFRAGAGRFEIGNFNLPDLHALAASLDLIEGVGVENIEAHLYNLDDRLSQHLDEQSSRLVGPRTVVCPSHSAAGRLQSAIREQNL